MPSRRAPNDDQHKRFIEAAHKAEYSEDEAVFDEALRRLTKPKPPPDRKPEKRGDG